MDTPVTGVDTWLTINNQPLSFHSKNDNLQVNAIEGKYNSIRITRNAPDDIEVWVDNEKLETERYGAWYWQPKGFAGLYKLTLVTHDFQKKNTTVRVLPSKMSYERYDEMLMGIQEVAEDLLFQFTSPSKEKLAPRKQTYASSALREYKLIKAIYHELAEIFSLIRRNPNTKLIGDSQSVLIHQVRRFSSEVIPVPGSLIQLNLNPSLSAPLSVLPLIWSVEDHNLSHDTYENRLLKYFIWRQLTPRLMSIREKTDAEIKKRNESLRIKQYQGWEDDETDKIKNLEKVNLDCQSLLMQCSAWGSEVFLKEVKITGQCNQPSQVLQKNPAYNRFYRVFLRFQNELGINLDADRYLASLSMRKISEIYEIWSIFKITVVVINILRTYGYQVISNNGFFTVRDDLFQFEVDRNATVQLLKGNRSISMRYEPIYEPAPKIVDGLVSKGQKQRTPDLSIEVRESNQISNVLVFDAKYRSEKDGDNDTFLDEDLNKMREYRDTIAYKKRDNPRLVSIVRSAYILYPGNVLEHDEYDMGIGALPFIPNMKKDLSIRVSKAIRQLIHQIC